MNWKRKKRKQSKQDQEQVDLLQRKMALIAEAIMSVENAEEKAGEITISLLTACQGITIAHEEEEDCAPHHATLAYVLQEAVKNPIIAHHVISNLAGTLSAYLTEEELQSMALTLAQSKN